MDQPRLAAERPTRVLFGYADIPTAPRCPGCCNRHYAIEDDGRDDSFRVRCWCGATARVAKDDPDLQELGIVAEPGG